MLNTKDCKLLNPQWLSSFLVWFGINFFFPWSYKCIISTQCWFRSWHHAKSRIPIPSAENLRAQRRQTLWVRNFLISWWFIIVGLCLFAVFPKYYYIVNTNLFFNWMECVFLVLSKCNCINQTNSATENNTWI